MGHDHLNLILLHLTLSMQFFFLLFYFKWEKQQCIVCVSVHVSAQVGGEGRGKGGRSHWVLKYFHTHFGVHSKLCFTDKCTINNTPLSTDNFSARTNYLTCHHHPLSLNCMGHWGTKDDFTISFLYFSLFSTAHWDLMICRPVHSPMLSSHIFLCLSCLLSPFTVPYKMVLARHDEQETWPYRWSLHLFTVVRRSSCGPIACWILAQISLLVTWSLYEMHSILR